MLYHHIHWHYIFSSLDILIKLGGQSYKTIYTLVYPPFSIIWSSGYQLSPGEQLCVPYCCFTLGNAMYDYTATYKQILKYTSPYIRTHSVRPDRYHSDIIYTVSLCSCRSQRASSISMQCVISGTSAGDWQFRTSRCKKLVIRHSLYSHEILDRSIHIWSSS